MARPSRRFSAKLWNPAAPVVVRVEAAPVRLALLYIAGELSIAPAARELLLRLERQQSAALPAEVKSYLEALED